MVTYEIQLRNLPNQSTIVNIDLFESKRTFKLDLSYREICGYWTITITDWDTKKVLLSNAPLVTGEHLDSCGNILKQMAYLNIGQLGICALVNDTTDYPNAKNIGSDFKVFWRDSIK